jgi:predicted glycosyltransferase
LIRALAFEKLSLVRTLPPAKMSVNTMCAAIEASLAESRQELIARANQALNFDGAHQAASHLLALAKEKRALTLKESLAS